MFEQAFKNIDDIQEKDHVDVVMINPAFGGKECKESQQNFPILTGETAALRNSLPLLGTTTSPNDLNLET